MVTAVQAHQQTLASNQHREGGKDKVVAVTSLENVNTGNNQQAEDAVLSKDAVISLPADGSVGDSSVRYSDIEYDDEEAEEETSESENGEWVSDLSLPGSGLQQRQEVAAGNGELALPAPEQSVFGDVCVKNSTNVHLGNKTFYKGPVTIKQFVYTNPTSIQEIDLSKCENGRISDANVSDYSSSKGEQSASKPILPKHFSYEKVSNWLLSWKCAALLCIIALFFVTIVISAVLLTKTVDADKSPYPQIPDSSSEGVITENVRFVTRLEWGAQPPSEPPEQLNTPVEYVIISHTATGFCKVQSECVGHVRFAQTFHIESRNWSDIAYNFLVGGDGLAYVGRGWDAVGAHTFGFNTRSIGISFIGTFNSVRPPKSQLHAAQRVIEHGVKLGKIATDYKLLGHRQVSQTLSPGDALYSVIRTWPHWSSTP